MPVPIVLVFAALTVLRTHLLCAPAPGQVPVVEVPSLAIGADTEVVLTDHDPPGPLAGPAQVFLLAPPVGGELYIHARVTDPVGAGCVIEAQTGAGRRINQARGGRGAAVLSLKTQASPNRLLVGVDATLAPGDRRILQVRTVFVANPEDSPAPTLQRLLGEVEALVAAGDVEGAATRVREGVTELDGALDTYPGPSAVRACLQLGVVASDLGAMPAALRLMAIAREGFERVYPDEFPDLQNARMGEALACHALGDLAGAEALLRKIVDVNREALPPGDERAFPAELNLATFLAEIGRLDEAGRALERLGDALAPLAPPTDPRLMMLRQNQAALAGMQGHMTVARAILETQLELAAGVLDDDAADVLRMRENLAAVVSELGDAERAIALLQRVAAVHDVRLPRDHETRRRTDRNLAQMQRRVGDHTAAALLFEEVLSSCERALPPGHPETTATRVDLAIALGNLGRYREATSLAEAALAELAADPRDDPFDRVRVGLLLAQVSMAQGRSVDARDRLQRLLAESETALGAESLPVIKVRANLGDCLVRLGDPEAALDLIAADIAHEQRAGVDLGETLLGARGREVRALAAIQSARDDGRLERSCAAMVQEFEVFLARLSAFSARQIEEALAAVQEPLWILLSITDEAGVSPAESLCLIERIRWVSARAESAACTTPDAQAARERLVAARQVVVELSVAAQTGDVVATPEAIGRAARQRDAAEQALRTALARDGAAPEVDLAEIARALGPHAAAVSFWRHADPGGVAPAAAKPWRLTAWVLRGDATVVRIELGLLAPIEAAVAAYRDQIGRPMDRGAAAEVVDAEDDAPGRELFEQILAPVLDAAGPVDALVVAPSQLLHLVPLDALPMGDGAVGDALRIRQVLALASLADARPRSTGDPSLLVLGGIDFNAPPDVAAAKDGDPSPAPADPAKARSTPTGVLFAPLRQTRMEAEAVVDLFENSFDVAAVLDTGRKATKEHLEIAAPGRRFLHIATHGYFAPPTIASRAADAGLGDAVVGLLPMTLSGLALAGANRGVDYASRAVGVVTAEELAGFDLSDCDLVVLSACDTSVGLARGGEGVASLRTALVRAGARACITSLWKVDDERTRELMSDFYTRLWVLGLPSDEALWAAKAALRDRGAPARDWAGWVLTGTP